MKINHRFVNAATSAAWILTAACAVATVSVTAVRAGTLGEDAARLGVSFMGNGVNWDWGKDDISGEVGYPLAVGAPTADCPSGGWSSDKDIASGELPPGLTMDEHGGVSGVPTARGHWIVVFRIRDVMCGGRHYTVGGAPDVLAQDQGWQDLDVCKEDFILSSYCSLKTVRFHIGGTGEVVQ